jgi:cytochrome c556
MKNKLVLLALVAITAGFVGCDQEPSTAQQIAKAQTETTQAAQDMKDYTYAEKAEFVQAMQAQLTALNQDLDQLAVKIEKASDTVKAEARPKLQALREQAAKLNDQLAEDQKATESTWDSVKAGTKKAYAATVAGINDARQWISEKIAP